MHFCHSKYQIIPPDFTSLHCWHGLIDNWQLPFYGDYMTNQEYFGSVN